MTNEVSNATHTPGPWIAVESLAIRTTNGSTLAQVRWDDFWDGDDIAARPRRDDEQAKANARLIAAAPELLEALEGVLRTEDSRFRLSDDDWSVFRQLARSAIAKARGAS